MTTKAVAVEHGGHGHAHASLENLKLGVWVFLASECIVFGSLIGTYLALWGRSVKGPDPHEMIVGAIPGTTVATFFLLASSFTMAMGIAAIRRGNVGGLQGWTLLTVLLGLGFVVLKLKDWNEMIAEGFKLGANIGADTFYTLTGTHLLHLIIGLVWLVAVMVQGARGRYSAQNATAVECAGLYWHFVDMVWMILFPAVYLFELTK